MGQYVEAADRGVRLLQDAMHAFKQAKAPRTVARIRLALSSGKGAVRAAGYRESRERYEAKQKAENGTTTDDSPCPSDPDGQHFVGCGCE